MREEIGQVVNRSVGEFPQWYVVLIWIDRVAVEKETNRVYITFGARSRTRRAYCFSKLNENGYGNLFEAFLKIVSNQNILYELTDYISSLARCHFSRKNLLPTCRSPIGNGKLIEYYFRRCCPHFCLLLSFYVCTVFYQKSQGSDDFYTEIGLH